MTPPTETIAASPSPGVTPSTREELVELIRRASTSLPADVEGALRAALEREASGSSAALILSAILENAALARANSTPLCQDTGTLAFYVSSTLREATTPDAIREAVREATALGLLRRNCIDSVTARSYDDNCAAGAPVIHYVESASPRVALLLKGGGSENMSRQYSLPDSDLGAGRDLDGVRKCILDAVHRAQGYGCAPGILGVCIGGDRASAFECAKRQLLRPLGDSSPDAALANLERVCLAEANTLGIGPMGLGGKTTLLGVKIGALARLPASFFVTVAYMCWACRRSAID